MSDGNRATAEHRALIIVPSLLFVAAFFLLPLLRFFSLAFTGEGMLSSFSLLLGSSVYREVFFNTIFVSVVVTALCATLAWPTAYVLSKISGWWFAFALYCVLFPLWTSVLVRTFSWMLLLETNGPINRFLLYSGLLDRPVKWLFSNTAVIVGMVHVLLPYMILPLFGAMKRIDGRLLLASDGLGATPMKTFVRIYLPLTSSGLIGGMVFVFLLSLGFFITPALLGSARSITLSMLIANLVNDRLAWPQAAAASIVLLVVVASLLTITMRLFKINRELFAR